MSAQGQILPDSPFGRVLTELAREAETILEIGCWHGGGSTSCLAAGLIRPTQRMWSIDLSAEMVAEARAANPDERITFLAGTILTPQECEEALTSLYEAEAVSEIKGVATYPCIYGEIPKPLDLVLLDGGEYSTKIEFSKLRDHVKVFALDDVRMEKNRKVHQEMESPLSPISWSLLHHQPYDRNGWSVFSRE